MEDQKSSVSCENVLCQSCVKHMLTSDILGVYKVCLLLTDLILMATNSRFNGNKF